jgi:hypothetical protein
VLDGVDARLGGDADAVRGDAVPRHSQAEAMGVFHNRLLGSGVSLPALFGWCGFILAIAGMGLVLYSYTRHSQRGRHGESKGPH